MKDAAKAIKTARFNRKLAAIQIVAFEIIAGLEASGSPVRDVYTHSYGKTLDDILDVVDRSVTLDTLEAQEFMDHLTGSSTHLDTFLGVYGVLIDQRGRFLDWKYTIDQILDTASASQPAA